MIKRISSVLLALSLTLASMSTLASKLSPEQAQKFIAVSGLGNAIDAMPDQFRQQFNIQALVAKDKRTIEVVSAAIQEAISNTNGYQIAESYLISDQVAGDLNNTIAFLETPLGQLIRSAEDQASKPEFMTEMQAYTTELGQNPPTESRSQLINNLVDALNMDDTMVEMVKTMIFSTVDVMAELEPELKDLAQSRMTQEWQSMEMGLRNQMSQYAVLSSYLVYKDLSDEQLKAYIEFLNTADGQIYWSASIEIFQRYVNQIMSLMIQNILESKA